VISEGSCETEYWGNYTENSALLYGNKLHFTIHIEKIIFHNYYCFCCNHKKKNN